MARPSIYIIKSKQGGPQYRVTKKAIAEDLVRRLNLKGEAVFEIVEKSPILGQKAPERGQYG